jgi:hypothetical protein
MRAVFSIGSVLVAVAGLQLYVLTDHTERLFAWTIDSGLSATFLGAFYWMALAVAIRSDRQEVWARARVGVYGVALFVGLTLLATLLHLDKFHLTEGGASAVIAGWAWLVVYVAAPAGVLAALAAQHRAPGHDPPRADPLSGWFRALLLAEGTLLLVAGGWLLVDPTSATWWPWELTPLVARAAAAWLLGLAVVLATAFLEGDRERIRVATTPYTLLAALLAVAAVRYAEELRGGASLALYGVALAIAGSTGLLGASGASRASTPDATSTVSGASA